MHLIIYLAFQKLLCSPAQQKNNIHYSRSIPKYTNSLKIIRKKIYGKKFLSFNRKKWPWQEVKEQWIMVKIKSEED